MDYDVYIIDFVQLTIHILNHSYSVGILAVLGVVQYLNYLEHNIIV